MSDVSVVSLASSLSAVGHLCGAVVQFMHLLVRLVYLGKRCLRMGCLEEGVLEEGVV